MNIDDIMMESLGCRYQGGEKSGVGMTLRLVQGDGGWLAGSGSQNCHSYQKHQESIEGRKAKMNKARVILEMEAEIRLEFQMEPESFSKNYFYISTFLINIS